jgi:hypothetical protein
VKDYEKYKIKIEKIMENSTGKVTLAKKTVHRNSYIFSVGKTQYLQNSIIFENDDITVFGEEVSKENADLIREVFKGE